MNGFPIGIPLELRQATNYTPLMKHPNANHLGIEADKSQIGES